MPYHNQLKQNDICILRNPKLLCTTQDEGSTRSVMLSAKYFEPLASVPVGLLLMKIIRKIDYIFFKKIKKKRKKKTINLNIKNIGRVMTFSTHI